MPADTIAPAQPPVDQLAARYANLVYRAAVRRMGGEGKGAEDVTQAVFLIALQKSQAGHLPEEPRMAGWLLKVTQYAAREARRAQTRRHHHESAAATQHPEATMHHPTDHDLTESLDDALLKLRPLDRELLARRYLQNQPVHHLAAALNIPENTASQRLARALEKLRKLLTRPGTTLPAAALTTLLLAESTKAVPTGLALTAATASTTSTAVAIAKGATAMMKIAALKTAGLALVASLLLGILSVIATIESRTQAAAPTPTASSAPAAAPTKPAEIIDAAALVREVRQKEEWIETAQSFYVKATWTSTNSKQSIAKSHQWNIEQLAREKDALDRAATEPPPPALEEQPATETKTLEMAFDARRTLFREWPPGRDWISVWNGTTGFGYLKYPQKVHRWELDAAGAHIESSEGRPVARVVGHVDPATDLYFVGQDQANNPMAEFFWPMAEPHQIWFTEDLNPNPLRADAGDFKYLRTEKVRGVDCYVLLESETPDGGGNRWSIGVKDHLLYRVEYGPLANPNYWKIYLPEAQKQGAFITDNKSLFRWLDSLDLNERMRLKYAIADKYNATAKAWIEYWFTDYVEAKPGKWFPRAQGNAYHDIHRFDGKEWVDDYENAFELFRNEIKVTDLRVDDPLPDSLFSLKIPEGAKVAEDIDGIRVEYPYKKNMSAAEKAAIVEKAKEQQELGNRMTDVAVAVNDYAFKRSAERKWPESLGATLSLVRLDGAEGPAPAKARASKYLSPEDQKNLVIPDNPSADWVDQHTSFVYLGKDVLVSKIPRSEWSRTVLLHERIEAANPAKEKFRLVFADLHNEMMTEERANEAIEASKKILATARAAEGQQK